MSDRFPILYAGERRTLTFQFGDDLEIGETLDGDPAVSLRVVKGTDRDPETNLGIGIPEVQGSDVLVAVEPTIGAVEYHIKVTMATSNPDKRLACGGRLPVEP